jgi:hypothetical protein
VGLVALEYAILINTTITTNALIENTIPAVVRGNIGVGDDQDLPALKAVETAMMMMMTMILVQMKAEVARAKGTNKSV